MELTTTKIKNCKTKIKQKGIHIRVSGIFRYSKSNIANKTLINNIEKHHPFNLF